MGKTYEGIADHLRAFIEAQPLFFVSTAPLAADGHVNVSPKGLDSFRVLGSDRVAYLDLTGSGNETSAHVAENGRITFLFCSFSGSPKILRLYGTGRTVLPGDEEWDELRPRFPDLPGARQIVLADVHRVQTSCGFGVPVMELVEERDKLVRWAESKGEEGLEEYHREKNARSIDALPTPLGLKP
ncbi:MAG: pyridoxamine 5'-phosphate oxidase family protein [Longimicrobiales bacterium]|nr:pyridoxamine 5'-phosphate oxidase family protein [Longimicrobiales bacterium]